MFHEAVILRSADVVCDRWWRRASMSSEWEVSEMSGQSWAGWRRSASSSNSFEGLGGRRLVSARTGLSQTKTHPELLIKIPRRAD